jgi:hypothetical protein
MRRVARRAIRPLAANRDTYVRPIAFRGHENGRANGPIRCRIITASRADHFYASAGKDAPPCAALADISTAMSERCTRSNASEKVNGEAALGSALSLARRVVIAYERERGPRFWHGGHPREIPERLLRGAALQVQQGHTLPPLAEAREAWAQLYGPQCWDNADAKDWGD